MRKQPFKEQPAEDAGHDSAAETRDESAEKHQRAPGGGGSGGERGREGRGSGEGEEDNAGLTPETSTPQSTPQRDLGDPTTFPLDVTPVTPASSSSSSGHASSLFSGASSGKPATASSVEKTLGRKKQHGKCSSRRSLFRHRKLENVCSDEDDDNNDDRVVNYQNDEDDMTEGDLTSTSTTGLTPGKMTMTKRTPRQQELQEQQQQQKLNKSSSSPASLTTSALRHKETPLRRSAKKGGDASSSVQYNRMRNQSEVEIDLTDCAGLNEFRV